MKHDIFEVPVQIYSGLNFRKEITSVGQAYAFLNSWPPARNCVDHEAALGACRAALEGNIDAETARAAFARFADRAGILAPELDDIIAARIVPPFERGRQHSNVAP